MALTEYAIQANTRRCATTGRELVPGERYFSVLVDENGKLVRKDFAHESWAGAPAGAFGFWSGRVPSPEHNPRPRFDDDLLADCFQRLEGQAEPGRLNFRYVVALLLMRRKRFKFEEARVEDGHEVLYLRCARSRAVHQVINPRLTDAEMKAVQDEVFQVLGWE